MSMDSTRVGSKGSTWGAQGLVMYLFKWYSLKISSISFFHSWKNSPSSIGTLCLRLLNVDSSIFLQWWLNQSNRDQSSDTNWKDREEVSRGGWIDYKQEKVAVFNFFKLRWSFSTCLNIHHTYQASMTRVYEQRKVRHANCKNVEGWDWSVQTQLETWRFFIHGSDRWCYRTSTLMETSTHEG